MLGSIALGFGIGFLGSLPVAGPLGVLVLAKGFAGLRREGLAAALGGALAEAAYAFLAFWGAASILAPVSDVGWLCQAAGASVLAVLGVFFIKNRKKEPRQNVSTRRSALGSMLSGFLLILLNPGMLVTWSLLSSALITLGLVTQDPRAAFFLAPGVFLGIFSWFALLLWVLKKVRHRLGPCVRCKIVGLLGSLLLVMSVVILVRLVVYLQRQPEKRRRGGGFRRPLRGVGRVSMMGLDEGFMVGQKRGETTLCY